MHVCRRHERRTAKPSDGGAAELKKAQKADLPEHNPEAVYNGKGVLEYAKPA